MSEINLLDLPDHVLAKILSHIPDHFEVSRVCKKFHEIDCFNSRKNSNILLKWSWKSKEILYSVLETKRSIRRMNFEVNLSDPKEVEPVQKIFKLHGSSVKELKLQDHWLRDSKIAQKTLVELLNCFPNLEELYLNLAYADVEPEVAGSCETLKLPKLEKINLCLRSPVFFKNRLPENLKRVEMRSSMVFRTSESKIAQLRAARSELLDKLKGLKLEDLSLHGMSRSLSEIPFEWPKLKNLLVAQQDCLKSLNRTDFDRRTSEPEFFYELKNIKQLESLEISGLSGFSAEKFSRLTKLKRLEIGSSPDLDELSLVKTVPLEELILGRPKPDVLEQFGRNFPIKSLKTKTEKVGLKFIMENFPLLESLELEIYNLSGVSSNFGNERVLYPKLKKLSLLLRTASSDFVSKILLAFPNLEELSILARIEISGDFVNKLKSSIGRLRKLKISTLLIDFEQLYSEESIEALQELSKALESIEFTFEVYYSRENSYSDRCLDKLRGYYRINIGKYGDLKLRKF